MPKQPFSPLPDEHNKDKKQHGLLLRGFFFAGGILAVILGVIGAFLPGLPTVVFFLLAVFCFARSSPKLEQWIITHPHFGPGVIAWREHGVIPKRSKIIAFCMIIFSYFILVTQTNAPDFVKILVGAILIGVVTFILSRPSYPKQ